MNLLQFAMNFTRLRNLLYYWRFSFSIRSLKVLKALQIYPCFASKNLERLLTLQCCPWPWPAARATEIRRRGRPRKSVGRSLGPLGVDLSRSWRSGGRRRAQPAKQGGGGRRSACSGELSVGEGNGAARTAPLGPRGCVEMVEWLRSRAGRRTRRRRQWQRRRVLQRARGRARRPL
jgi:hypothetical protein